MLSFLHFPTNFIRDEFRIFIISICVLFQKCFSHNNHEDKDPPKAQSKPGNMQRMHGSFCMPFRILATGFSCDLPRLGHSTVISFTTWIWYQDLVPISIAALLVLLHFKLNNQVTFGVIVNVDGQMSSIPASVRVAFPSGPFYLCVVSWFLFQLRGRRGFFIGSTFTSFLSSLIYVRDTSATCLLPQRFVIMCSPSQRNCLPFLR